MAVIAQNLQPGITLSATSAPIVTAGAGTNVITSAVLTNPTAAAVSVTVQIKRAGGSALDLVPSRAIQPNGTDLLPELIGRVLGAGDQILALGAGLVCVVDGYSLS